MYRRAAASDAHRADGRFTFRGMPNLQVSLRAVSPASRQLTRQVFPLGQRTENIELRLTPIAPLTRTPIVERLGIKFATVTPEVRTAYAFADDMEGAVVIDPGPEATRLGLAELREGDVLCRVGNGYKWIDSADQLMAAVLFEAKETDTVRPWAISISYRTIRVDDDRVTSAQLKLRADDVNRLKLPTRP